MSDSDFITVREAATIAGKSERTIWDWLKKEFITRYGAGTNTLISKRELINFITPKKA